ncbi:MAG: adaptor protein MecA [Clostridia bacterium]|nr:adaptor protein MecA [Clostridia bacterium]
MNLFCGVRHLEVRLLSDSEIRITLSCEEMEKFDIDADSFSDGFAAKEILRELFLSAGGENSFGDADALSVKLFPKRSGGCELFVSKLSGAVHKKTRERIYCFESADDFLKFYSFLPRGEAGLIEKLFVDGKCYIRFFGLLCERSERILEEFAVRERGCYLWDYLLGTSPG